MKNFNPYIQQQKNYEKMRQQAMSQIPTGKDLFKKFFTKLDLLALIIIFIVSIFGIHGNTKILINSFSIGLIFMPKFIILMRRFQKYGQPIRIDGPQSHITNKKNTPTMGGLFIIFFTLFLSLIFCNTGFIYIPLFCLILYGALGGYDDFLKIKKNNSNGISAKRKFVFQIAIGASLAFLMYSQNHDLTKIYFPFFGLIDITIWAFIPFATFIIVGSSNAFNLTDGLDGLSITQFFAILGFFLAVTLGFTHHSSFISSYLYDQEMAKFLLVIFGVSLSFFWFNNFPAKIFMGDVGSLAFGALIGVVSLMLSLPILLIFSCIILIIETVSVIIQVYFYKKTKGQRRFFLMTPIHHHFEKQNIHENNIVQAMFIVAIIFNIIASQI